MNLQSLRKMAGLSQTELGVKLGISDSTISKYECGQGYPSAEVLIKMADFFNVSVDTILGRNSKLVDLETLSKNQRDIVEAVVGNLSDINIAKVAGYIENIKE